MEVQRIASNIFFFFCKNMHDLYTSVHLRVTHCLTKFREAHYASNILSDILPGQRGKPNTVTLSIECNSILEAAQDQPASSLPETGGGGWRGVRRHTLHFHSFFKHFLWYRSLGSTVVHFGPYLFLFNIQFVQHCCKFKSQSVTRAQFAVRRTSLPQILFFKDYWQTRKKSFILIISWDIPRDLVFAFLFSYCHGQFAVQNSFVQDLYWFGVKALKTLPIIEPNQFFYRSAVESESPALLHQKR